jgi:glycosyltransferase involved in cell wall biosynthesis
MGRTNRYMVTPLVSIIIPCYRQAEYLGEALDSVLAQTYPHWEAIVVNDASPDNTKEIAMGYASKDVRITLLNLEQNTGLPNARNSGIKATKGVFILPLDADDKIAPTYLEKSLQVFSENPLVKVVYTDVQCFGIRQDKVQRPDPD